MLVTIIQNFIIEIDMCKNNRLNILKYLFVKYIVFFTVLAFTIDRFKNSVIDNAVTSREMFKLTGQYIMYVLIYTLPLILIFIFPLYHILKVKRAKFFIIYIILLFISEYFIYTYLYASSNKILGIYNLGIGVILLWLFFYKSILIKFNSVGT